MSSQEFPKASNSAAYREKAERAKADKPPNRSRPMGTVARTRAPGVTSRKQMQHIIMEQDDLATDLQAPRCSHPTTSIAPPSFQELPGQKAATAPQPAKAFIKIGPISLLIVASALENDLLSLTCTC